MAEKELTFEKIIWAVEVSASMHQAARTLSQIAGRNITAQDVNRMLRLYSMESKTRKKEVELAKKAMYTNTKRLVLVALKEGKSLKAIAKFLRYRDRDSLIGTLNWLKKNPEFAAAYEKVRLGQGRKPVKRMPKPRIRRR